jgi:hypothetical protein
MAFPQPFSVDKMVDQSGNNGDIFSLTGRFLQHRRRSFVWQNAVAWVDKKREDISILLVLKDMTWQHGLHIDERETVGV